MTKEEVVENFVEIPENVAVSVNDSWVALKGQKGELKRNFYDPRFSDKIQVVLEDRKIAIRAGSSRKKVKAYVYTIGSHVKNMILGVTKGFTYKMKIFYTHFPITVEVKGKAIIIKNFLGEKGFRIGKVVGDTKVEVKKDEIVISGKNKEDVSQTAANIEKACRLSKKDRRVFLDGIYITNWEVGK